MSRENEIVMAQQGLTHPVVQAWFALDRCQRTPEGIEVIRPMSKSTPVFRLLKAGADGCSVIAKKQQNAIARIEQEIYENVFPLMSKPMLHYYGHVEAGDQTNWLFIEDVGGDPFSFDDPDHASLAIDWLAELHTVVPRLDGLPEHGLVFHASRLHSGYEKIKRHILNPSLRKQDRDVLKMLLHRYDVILEQWACIESYHLQMPDGFAHGDFKAKNLRVRSDGQEKSLLVFDWEDAAWGITGIDLWRLSSEAYWKRVQMRRPAFSLDQARQIKALGKLVSCFVGIDWAAGCLEGQWITDAMDKLTAFEWRLSQITPAIIGR